MLIMNLSLSKIECRSRPWYLTPTAQRFLYVRLHGIYLRKHSSPDRFQPDYNIRTHLTHLCETKSRVILTNADGTTVTACPLSRQSARHDVVEMFSSGWQERQQFEHGPMRSRAVSVEFINPDHEDYVFAWLEMEPRRGGNVRMVPDGGGGGGGGAMGGGFGGILSTITTSSTSSSSAGSGGQTMTVDCVYRCPELDVCVNATVWCDGVQHCPSGIDESFTHCSAILRLPAEILASICVVLLLVCGGLLLFCYRWGRPDSF